NQLRILPIRLLFACSLAVDLGCVSDPQLELQLPQQSFEPACMSAGLHADTHLLTPSRQSAIERLWLLGMCQSLLLERSLDGFHGSHLLKLGVEIYSYNDHRSAPFSRACWLA